MRKLVLLVFTFGLLGASAPARGETANWATYAFASSQYSVGNLSEPVFPLAGMVFCGVDLHLCLPLPDDVVAGINNGVNDSLYGNWAAMQATGAPNTYPSCGDIPTAWTPLPSGNEATVAGQDPVAEPEWLTLVYNPPVQGANRVDVYETNLGSFVTQVDVWVADGPPIVVFNGPDTTACPGILSIPFSTDLPVVGVTVQTAKVGWEEIDAVAVIN